MRIIVDIDPVVKDAYGIPAARLHFEWDKNTLLMWEHGKHSCEQLLRASGAEYQGSAPEPDMPGTSLHETGTLRMGNDPKRFVTNRFGQAHDVPNLVRLRCQRVSQTAPTRPPQFRSSRSRCVPSEYLVENLKKS